MLTCENIEGETRNISLANITKIESNKANNSRKQCEPKEKNSR